MKKITLLFLILCFGFSSIAQVLTIKGNAQTNSGEKDQSGIFVQIMIFETQIDVQAMNSKLVEKPKILVETDEDGNYSADITMTANPLASFLPFDYFPITIIVSANKDGYKYTELTQATITKPGTYTLENALIFPQDANPYRPQICMASKDTNTNITNVIWEREMGNNIESYYIYKKESDDWLLYDSLEYSQLSVYEDLGESSPSDLYQIQAKFTDGSLSLYSKSAKIPYIDVSMTEDGFPEIKYFNPDDISKADTNLVNEIIVFRSFENEPFEPIMKKSFLELYKEILKDPVSALMGTMTQTVDKTMTKPGVYRYRVGFSTYSPCIADVEVQKAESGPFSLALSNIAESEEVTNIQNQSENPTSLNVSVQIKPSLFVKNKTLIISTESPISYQISNILGQTIAKGTATEIASINLNSGLYIVQYGDSVEKIQIP